MSRMRRIGMVAGAVAVVMATSATAQAENLVRHDPRGDVRQIHGERVGDPAPGNRINDIDGYRASYGDSRLRLVLHAASLSDRTGRALHYVAFGQRLLVAEYPIAENGHFEIGYYTGDDTVPFNCAGVVHRVNKNAGTVLLTIPSRCLPADKAVRVGGDLITYRKNSDDGFADTAFRAGLGTYLDSGPDLSRLLKRS